VETPESAERTQAFFQQRQAAAVLKHAILKRYLPPFAAKTGSTSIDNRVAIVDGYAGAGRYDDGAPGSPAIIADLSHAPALRSKTIEAYFVESHRPTYARLMQNLQNDAPDLHWTAWQGELENHLPELIKLTQNVPLFLFLDPFGHGLAFDTIQDLFLERPTPNPYAPATEALIRIDASAIWRTRGVARRPTGYYGREATLHRMDQTAGGTWWRDDDPGTPTADYLEWFASELLHHTCQEYRCWGWSVDVRQRPDRLPVYYLLFLTRHRDGMDTFGEVLSKSMEEWRRSVLEIEYQESLLADDINDEYARREEMLAAEWHDQLRENILALLDEKPSFQIRQELSRVMGNAAGLARSMHLRAVLKELYLEGITQSDSKGDIYAKRVIRAV